MMHMLGLLGTFRCHSCVFHFFPSTTGRFLKLGCFTAKVHHGRQLFPWASASTQIATSPTPLGLTDQKAAVVVRSIQRIKSKHISVCFSQLVAKLQTCIYHKIMQHDPMKCLLENCASRGPLNAEASSLVRAIVENWTSRQDRTYCNLKVSQTFCFVLLLARICHPKEWWRFTAHARYPDVF